MKISERENYLKAARFETPERVPMVFAINQACWTHYPHTFLFDMLESHKLLFPDFVRPLKYDVKFHALARKDEPFTDDFGCVWETAMDGITGSVHKHPISDWSDYKNYVFPDPRKCNGICPVDWAEEKAEILRQKQRGELTVRGLRHGHTYLQLCDIRGYENLTFDMTDEEPLLQDLIDKLYQFNLYIIEQYASAGCDVITIAEDLGMQFGPMLSPDCFEKYILPSYSGLVRAAKKNGALVHMHSDGDIRTLLKGITGGGVDIINLQDLVNGIDFIKEKLKGRICIDLDIDRQKVTPFMKPSDVDALIKKEVGELGSKQGGLMMIYGLYPGIPLENVKALMDAMEKYSFYFG